MTGSRVGKRLRRAGWALAVALAAGCGGGPGEAGRDAPPGRGEGPVGGEEIRIVFLGDSLTAGYGLEEEQAFPARLERRLRDEGYPVTAVNAGVSGDTTAGGLRRVDWVLRQRPELVVLALGANDGLRGLSPETTEENLRQIVERSRDAGARVILAGMKLPPNYGPFYVRRFERLYPRLADELDVELVPFLLEGVAGRPELNLPDGIHPNAEGHRRIAETVLPFVRAALG